MRVVIENVPDQFMYDSLCGMQLGIGIMGGRIEVGDRLLLGSEHEWRKSHPGEERAELRVIDDSQPERPDLVLWACTARLRHTQEINGETWELWRDVPPFWLDADVLGIGSAIQAVGEAKRLLTKALRVSDDVYVQVDATKITYKLAADQS